MRLFRNARDAGLGLLPIVDDVADAHRVNALDRSLAQGVAHDRKREFVPGDLVFLERRPHALNRV